jgi:hypothetical protein
VRDEVVVFGISHGGIEKAFNHQDAGGLVEFILDGLTAVPRGPSAFVSVKRGIAAAPRVWFRGSS